MNFEYFLSKHIDDIKTIEEANWLKENSFFNPVIYYNALIRLGGIDKVFSKSGLKETLYLTDLITELEEINERIKSKPELTDNLLTYEDIASAIGLIIENEGFKKQALLKMLSLYKYYLDINEHYYNRAINYLVQLDKENKKLNRPPMKKRVWEVSILRRILTEENVRLMKKNFNYNVEERNMAKNRYPMFQHIFQIAENGYYQDAYDILEKCTETSGTTVYYYLLLLAEKIGIVNQVDFDDNIINHPFNTDYSYQHDLRIAQYFLDKHLFVENEKDLIQHIKWRNKAIQRFVTEQIGEITNKDPSSARQKGELSRNDNSQRRKLIGFPFSGIQGMDFSDYFKLFDKQIDYSDFYKSIDSFYDLFLNSDYADINSGGHFQHGWRDMFPQIYQYLREVEKENI